MILAPLSDWRAQIGTTFIIDLWFYRDHRRGPRRVRDPAGDRDGPQSRRCALLARLRRLPVPAEGESDRIRRALRARPGHRGREGQRAAAPGVAVQLDGVRLGRRSAPLRPRQSGAAGAARPTAKGDGFVAMLDSVYQPLCLRALGDANALRRGQGAGARAGGVELAGDGGVPLVRRPARRTTARARDRPACGSSTCASTRRGAAPSRSATAPAATAPSAPWRLVPPRRELRRGGDRGASAFSAAFARARRAGSDGRRRSGGFRPRREIARIRAKAPAMVFSRMHAFRDVGQPERGGRGRRLRSGSGTRQTHDVDAERGLQPLKGRFQPGVELRGQHAGRALRRRPEQAGPRAQD